MILIILIIVAIAIFAIDKNIKKQREELYNEVLYHLRLSNVDSLLREYDDKVIVKSRQTLNNYDDIKYLRENDCFDNVMKVAMIRNNIKKDITKFLRQNTFTQRPQYAYVAKQLKKTTIRLCCKTT